MFGEQRAARNSPQVPARFGSGVVASQLRLPAAVALLRLLSASSPAVAAAPERPAPSRGVALLQTASQSSRSAVIAARAPHSGEGQLPAALVARKDGRRRRRQVDARALESTQAQSLLGSHSQPSQPQGVALIAVGSAAHQAAQRSFPDADFFGGFSDDESTFDADGADHFVKSLSNLGPDQSSQTLLPDEPVKIVMPPEWFEESRSGGPREAWQTFYPSVNPKHPFSETHLPWHRVPTAAHFEQSFASPAGWSHHYGQALTKDAEWFEASIGQYDALGRQRAPSEFSDRFYLGWEERRANATLTCGPPGCTANASLQVVDVEAEQFHGCVLSVAVHPTDFDDDHSKENIEWITVNGKIASKPCDPKASGCHPAAAEQMYPCLTDLEVDDLLRANGTLHVAGKLSPMVDECPKDGNLLSGLVSVRCFVRNKTADEELRNDLRSSPSPSPHQHGSGNATLRCKEPGCTAETLVMLSSAYESNDTCRLTIHLRQTDFDGSEYEEVEWVKINGEVVREHVKPGRNPCKEAVQGGNGTGAEPYVLLDAEDVTAQVAWNGSVRVSAKISAMVDECGAPSGHLLDANITIDCGNASGADSAGQLGNASSPGEAAANSTTSAPSPAAPAPAESAAGGGATNETGSAQGDSNGSNSSQAAQPQTEKHSAAAPANTSASDTSTAAPAEASTDGTSTAAPANTNTTDTPPKASTN